VCKAQKLKLNGWWHDNSLTIDYFYYIYKLNYELCVIKELDNIFMN